MKKLKRLTKQDIITAQDAKTAEVPVPEWFEDGYVVVRSLTSGERDAVEREWSIAKKDNELGGVPNYATAKVVRLGLIGDDGKSLFAESELRALAGKSAAPMTRLFNRIMELSGMNIAAVDEAEKNSVSGQNGSSGLNSATVTDAPSPNSNGTSTPTTLSNSSPTSG